LTKTIHPTKISINKDSVIKLFWADNTSRIYKRTMAKTIVRQSMICMHCCVFQGFYETLNTQN